MLNRERMLYRYIRRGEIKNGLLAYLGKDIKNNHHCIICGNRVNAFYPYGENNEFFLRHNIIGGGYRYNCQCLHCKSLDRERWQYYVILNHTNILTGRCSVLHIAPETWLSKKIRMNDKCSYYSGDIRKGEADHIIDITNMVSVPDNSYDYVIINHVMEHVLDEKGAFSEIQRVLKQNGELVLSFPICTDDVTCENSDADSDEKRLFYYGQKDHVRLYGTDYKDRVENNGFKVKVYSPENEMTIDNIDRYGFIRNDVMMLCKLKNSEIDV